MTTFSMPDYRQRLAFDRKIVKAEDYRVLLEAKDLVSGMKDHLRLVREQNEAVFEQQKAAGYEAGLKQAKLQQTELIFAATAQVIDYVSSVEQTMVRIVLSVIRRIFNDFDNTDIVAGLVQQGLQQFREQASIRVYIPAGDEAQQMRKSIETVLAPAAGLGLADIVETPGLNNRACRLESEMGSVDVDLETFLQAMESALNEHFAAK